MTYTRALMLVASLLCACGANITGTTPDNASQRDDAGQPETASERADASTPDSAPPLPPGEPIVNLLIPSDTTLHGAENRIRWSIHSSGTTIAVKKTIIGAFVHPYNESAGRESWNWRERWSWRAEDLRLRRNDTEMAASSYRVITWSFPMSSTVVAFHVVFTTEERVTTDETRYELVLPINGTLTTGDAIELSLQTGVEGSSNEPGRLLPVEAAGGAYGVPGPHIYTGPAGICPLPTSTASIGEHVRQSDFVWSRLGPGHSYEDCRHPSSVLNEWFPRTTIPTTQRYRLVAP